MAINEPTFGQHVSYDEQAKKFVFHDTGFDVPYDGPFQNIFGFAIYGPGGGRLEFGNLAELRKNPQKNRLGISVSKERLLRGVLEHVQSLGADIFPNTNVSDVQSHDSGAVVVDDQGERYEGAFVIAADGINSRIARVMGLNKQRQFYGTTRDVSALIEGTACPDPDGFLFMITPGGIFSMIPVAEKDRYHIYASTFRPDQSPPDMIRYFLHDAPVFSRWYAASTLIDHRTACVVNLMSPMERPVCGNVVFAGDACWRREISNVGAMCTGWKAGQAVVDALGKGEAGEVAVQQYLDWYHEHYFVPHGNRKQGGRDFNEYLTPDDIDYLIGLGKGEFPQTMDIFKVVNFIGSRYAELMERIYDERPDTMERMLKMRENMDEDLKKRVSWGFKNV
jgi:flavin-dependent dehydrogenase